MFCPKCGKHVDDNLKYCPRCGYALKAERDARGNRRAGNDNKRQKSDRAYYTGNENKPGKNSKMKLMIVTVAVATVVFVGAGLLIVNGLLGSRNSQTQTDTSEDTGFEAYYKDSTDEDIVFENGSLYVDSQILLTADSGVSKDQVEKIAADKGGQIVGYISITNDYQIEFADGKTYDELEQIIDEWNQDDRIESAIFNYAVPMEADSVDYKNDSWTNSYDENDKSGSEWSEAEPDGSNWWAEAISMPTVWDMDIDFQPVKVGIYDSMFDTDHDDLNGKFEKVLNNPEDQDGNCMVSALYDSAEKVDKTEEADDYAHGTHVAGLIAANDASDGAHGITGIAQNARLYGFSHLSTPSDTEDISRWGDIFEIKYAISYMLGEGVRVINLSVSFEEQLVAAQHGVENAVNRLETYSTSMESFLSKCLNAGYDFLIIKSAGNQNECAWVECDVSSKHIYGYEKDWASKSKTKYDAKYDFLGAIDDENVKDHIIIVGAVENHGNYYKTADFSVIGSRVDVYAPGVDILSDVPSDKTKTMGGTSMAAPIVTGIASLVWGANPDLNALQVADIIKASVSATLFDSEEASFLMFSPDATPIVNAYCAVQLALDTPTDENGAVSSNGIITGMTYIEADDEHDILEGVSVTVSDADGNVVGEMDTSREGGFSFVLPEGNYTFSLKKTGYNAVDMAITVTKSKVQNVNILMEKLDDISNYIDSLDIMMEKVGGRFSEETGAHESWVIAEDMQYGNYFDSTAVDEIYFESEKYSLFNIYLAMENDEAKETLTGAGWNLVEEKTDYCEFKMDDSNLSYHMENNAIVSISFWKDMTFEDPAPEPVEEPVETPDSGSNSAGNSYASLDDFIRSGNYLNYTSDWYAQPTEYTLLDINQDRVQELIINAPHGDDFSTFGVFCFDQSSGEVSFAGSYNYCYELEYSAQYSALAFSDTRPGIMEASESFYVLENESLIESFTVSWGDYLGIPYDDPSVTQYTGGNTLVTFNPLP